MRRERGAALVVVILVTFTLALLGAGTWWVATAQVRQARQQEFTLRALNMAESALHLAYTNLPNDPDASLRSQTFTDPIESSITEKYEFLHKTVVDAGLRKYDVWVLGQATRTSYGGATRYVKARVIKDAAGLITVLSWREITPDEYARDKQLGGW